MKKQVLKSKQEKADVSKPGIVDYSVLKSPFVTEKSSMQPGSLKRVVFRVSRNADKDKIKEAVENIFKVEVSQVRTTNYFGKVKRGRNSLGQRAHYKKAYVTLKEGHSISIVEGL